jgi:hypothetical protein
MTREDREMKKDSKKVVVKGKNKQSPKEMPCVPWYKP